MVDRPRCANTSAAPRRDGPRRQRSTRPCARRPPGRNGTAAASPRHRRTADPHPPPRRGTTRTPAPRRPAVQHCRSGSRGWVGGVPHRPRRDRRIDHQRGHPPSQATGRGEPVDGQPGGFVQRAWSWTTTASRTSSPSRHDRAGGTSVWDVQPCWRPRRRATMITCMPAAVRQPAGRQLQAGACSTAWRAPPSEGGRVMSGKLRTGKSGARSGLRSRGEHRFVAAGSTLRIEREPSHLLPAYLRTQQRGWQHSARKTTGGKRSH